MLGSQETSPECQWAMTVRKETVLERDGWQMTSSMHYIKLTELVMEGSLVSTAKGDSEYKGHQRHDLCHKKAEAYLPSRQSNRTRNKCERPMAEGGGSVGLVITYTEI